MKKAEIVKCAHCDSSGRCQCDYCQLEAFGEFYSSKGHYATCSVCGGAGEVAIDLPYTTCSHCDGEGKCQCDGCQQKYLGETWSSNGHYTPCSSCKGAGKASIRYLS